MIEDHTGSLALQASSEWDEMDRHYTLLLTDVENKTHKKVPSEIQVFMNKVQKMKFPKS